MLCIGESINENGKDNGDDGGEEKKCGEGIHTGDVLRFLKNEGSFQFRPSPNGSRETATPNPPKRGN